MMEGIQNFLQFINDNWTSITVIIALVLALAQKIKSFIAKTNEEKVDAAKAQIREIMLKLITDAEVDYDSWNAAGSIKRSQVIQQIFTDFPILSKAVDQQAVIEWIDVTINEALKTLRKIVAEQDETAVV